MSQSRYSPALLTKRSVKMGQASRYLLVAWDFIRTGGMDMANHALASYLADSGRDVHILAASASEDLTQRPNIHFHRIPRLAHSTFLSAPLLDNAGRRLAATTREPPLSTASAWTSPTSL